jgi:RNA polymerase sigma-70 factor, ECF subfamily
MRPEPQPPRHVPQDAGREVLRELYARYASSVYARCRYLLRDEARAEDAMQDVFARALQNLPAFRAEASPATWLMKIATHHCLNQLRAERAPWHALFRRAQEARPEGHGGEDVFAQRDALVKLLARFDLETQAAVVHYHLDEMTLQEVADLLGRSVPTIRKRLETFARATGEEWKE